MGLPAMGYGEQDARLRSPGSGRAVTDQPLHHLVTGAPPGTTVAVHLSNVAPSALSVAADTFAAVTDQAHLQTTRDSYDQVAGQYADYVLEVFPTDRVDRAMIGLFADLVAAQDHSEIADIGCGPGHITDFLARRGLPVRGIDLSPEMIDLARRARPDLTFELGSMLELGLPDGELGGVLAHYSIIHTPPDRVPVALAEFTRVLAPGGYLLVSFQTGDDTLSGCEVFDHKAAPAYRWSLSAMAALLAPAGLVEVARLRAEPSPSNRFHEGHLLARKVG